MPTDGERSASAPSEDGFRAMREALERFLRAGGPDPAGDEPPETLATAEIERRISARLARACAALARRPEPPRARAEDRAAAYRRLAEAAAAQLPDDLADAFRLRLALDLCGFEAELERRAAPGGAVRPRAGTEAERCPANVGRPSK